MTQEQQQAICDRTMRRIALKKGSSTKRDFMVVEMVLDDIVRCEFDKKLLEALRAAHGYMLNAQFDLQGNVKRQTALDTLSGGIKLVKAAIAEAEGKQHG